MQIQNKLEKFLVGISSVLLMIIAVLGFKIKEDAKKIEQIKDSLNDYLATTTVNNAQDIIGQTREQILTEAVQSISANEIMAKTKKTKTS